MFRTAVLALMAVQAWGASYPVTVFVVRHAERSTTPAMDPVLSEGGKARAKALAAVLRDTGVTAIYASEAMRTQLTAKPLADLLHLEVNHTFPARQPKELAQAILDGQDQVLLVVGHSNTVPQIVTALGGGEVPAVQDAWEFDNLYVVTIFGPGKVSTRRLHYGETSASPPKP